MKKKFLQRNKKSTPSMSKGFTILELMVAITLFLVVIMSGISSLVGVTFSLNRSSKVVAIIDNLSFVMEDMSRNIRTGEAYSCILNSTSTPLSCPISGSLDFSFDESINAKRWGYKIITTSGSSNIYKYYDLAGAPSESVKLINSPEIEIMEGSGFFVYGAETPNADGSGDKRQPFVIIRLVGEINYRGQITSFNLQSSVSQMSLDLNYE